MANSKLLTLRYCAKISYTRCLGVCVKLLQKLHHKHTHTISVLWNQNSEHGPIRTTVTNDKWTLCCIYLYWNEICLRRWTVLLGMCILYFVCVIVGQCQHIFSRVYVYAPQLQSVFNCFLSKPIVTIFLAIGKWHIFGVFHLNAKYIGVVDLFDSECVSAALSSRWQGTKDTMHWRQQSSGEPDTMYAHKNVSSYGHRSTHMHTHTTYTRALMCCMSLPARRVVMHHILSIFFMAHVAFISVCNSCLHTAMCVSVCFHPSILYGSGFAFCAPPPFSILWDTYEKGLNFQISE